MIELMVEKTDYLGRVLYPGDRVIYAYNTYGSLAKAIVTKIHSKMVTIHFCNDNWELKPISQYSWYYSMKKTPDRLIKVNEYDNR